MFKQRSDAIIKIYSECDEILEDMYSEMWLRDADGDAFTLYCINVFGTECVLGDAASYGDQTASNMRCSIARDYLYRKLYPRKKK